jgi:hypothetical protein
VTVAGPDLELAVVIRGRVPTSLDFEVEPWALLKRLKHLDNDPKRIDRDRYCSTIKISLFMRPFLKASASLRRTVRLGCGLEGEPRLLLKATY